MAGSINIDDSECGTVEGNIVVGDIVVDGVSVDIKGNIILSKLQENQKSKCKDE